ncbi:MAG: CPBP family intramembrane glutamic endopeptidase [Chlamydiia bacterium]
MDDQSVLITLGFLLVIAIFSHVIAWKTDLFIFLKTDLHKRHYPIVAGVLSTIAIACYLFQVPFIPWYAPCILLLAYFAIKERDTFAYILKDKSTLPPTTYLKDALMGATIFIVAFPLLSFFQSFVEWILVSYFNMEVPKQFFIDFIKQIRTNIPLVIFTFTLVCIIVPLYEEFLYRANIQNWLRNYLPPFWAIFCTSLLFSISHFFTVDTIQGKCLIISSIFIASMYLGFAYERQRSLISSFTFHALINTLTFVQALFID